MRTVLAGVGGIAVVGIEMTKSATQNWATKVSNILTYMVCGIS